MDKRRSYLRCSLVGYGEIHSQPYTKDNEFEVVDMSASGVRILTLKDLSEGKVYDMVVKLSGHIFEISIRISGKIIRKIKVKKGYEYGIEFQNLTQQDRVEIDEMMKTSCNVGSLTDYAFEHDSGLFSKIH